MCYEAKDTCLPIDLTYFFLAIPSKLIALSIIMKSVHFLAREELRLFLELVCLKV